MTRLCRIIVCVVLLELIAVAVGMPLARWPAITGALSDVGALHRLTVIRLAITFATPAILLMAWLLFERRLAVGSDRISPAQRGYAEAGLVVVAFFLMAYQAWFASHLGQGHEAYASRDLMLRAGAVFAGMVMAVQGNFSSKAPAPQGSDPGSWTAARLRAGWAMSLAGLAIALCAIVVPLTALLPVFLVLGLAAISYLLIQRRSLVAGRP